MNHTDHIALLGKYLSGECTEKERNAVQQWTAQSPENQIIFEEYRKIWMLSGMDVSQLALDVHKGWNDLEQRIRVAEAIERESGFEKQPKIRKMVYVIARVAAVILIAFGLYYVFQSVNNNRQITPGLSYVASEVSGQPFVLPDGSDVYLNKEAKITYPENFDANTREINFEGEAFFDVAHNAEKPFIIHCGEVEVEVLGTSFNLCTCPGDKEIVLYLESGKVRFSSLDKESGQVKEQLLITPGCKAVYNRESGTISRSAFKGQNYLAWKTGVLDFEKSPLPEVFNVLEDAYNLKINTNRTCNELTLTAHFDHETPESIFEVLKTIYGFNYTISDKTVTIN